MSVPRQSLVCAAAAVTAALVVRAALGPFRIPEFHTLLNSPFTAENLFWLALLALLLTARGTNAIEHAAAGFPRLPLALALSAVAIAFAHNLADPFLSDDYIILNIAPFHWNTFLTALQTPGGDGAFRPLGAAYYQIVKTLAGRNPVAWHVTGLALHLLNCALVFAIAWKLWRDKTTATVAALVFGLHGTRPESALWTAGNFDLLACACVLGSIAFALSKRLTPALVLAAAGVLFKESAYATPLLALGILWYACHARHVRPLREFRAYLLGATLICAALFAWRWHLFHGPGGYIDPTTGRPAILSLHPLTAAKALLLRIWDILLVPVNWDAPNTWWLAAALLAWLAGLIWLASRAKRTPRMPLILATACAVLPAMHLALIGQSEMGSRILYLAGAPFALLIGSLALTADRRTIAVSAIMLAGMTGILEHNLNTWRQAALQAQTLCRQAAPTAPSAFHGVFLFQNGYTECVAAARGAK